MKSRLAVAGAGVVLMAVVFALYFPTWGTPFIYDDILTLKLSPYVRTLWPLTTSMSAEPQSPLSGRPLVAFSFALNYAWTQLDVWSWHAVNTLIHACNAVLVFLLLRGVLAGSAKKKRAVATTDGEASRGTFEFSADALLAFCAAMIWAVHPLNSEAVIYLMQRTELLVTFFYLLTLVAWLRGLDAGGGVASKRWFFTAIGACFLGMTCKEVMVSAPVAVLLVEATRGGRVTDWASRVKAIWVMRGRFYVWLFAAWLPLIWLVVTSPRGNTAGFGKGMGAGEYLLTQAGVLTHYLKLFFWPWPLIMFHDWPMARGLSDVAWEFALIAGLFAVCVAGVIRGRRWATGGMIAFMVLAPSSSFIPITTEVITERRMYLPSAMLTAILVFYGARGVEWVIARLERGGRAGQGMDARRPAGMACGALVIGCVFFAMTRDRGREWSSGEVFWRQQWAWYPEHPLILDSMGVQTLAAGREREAIGYFEHAARSVESGRWKMYIRLTEPMETVSRVYMKRQEPARAVYWLQKAVSLRPLRPRIWHDLANAQLAVAQDDAGRAGAAATMQKAVEIGAESIARFGVDRPTTQEMSTWRVELAVMLLRLGRGGEAARQIDLALADDPGNWRALVLRARMSAARQELNQAVRDYRRAIELNPGFTPLRAEFDALFAPPPSATILPQAPATNPAAR